jgi:hypothetical protein
MDPATLPVDLWVSERKSHYAFDSQTRTMTVIDYKGYRIEVCSVGRGWRASIFSPGSTTPWPTSPVNLEKSSTEEIVAEAKRIIEVRLKSNTEGR